MRADRRTDGIEILGLGKGPMGTVSIQTVLMRETCKGIIHIGMAFMETGSRAGIIQAEGMQEPAIPKGIQEGAEGILPGTIP